MTERTGSGILTVLVLGLGLRVVLLMVLPAEALFQYGDFAFYFRLASWSVPGHCPTGPAACWPLIDYWYEFPPIFPYLSIAIFRLVGGGGVPPFHTYAYALALMLIIADLVGLTLVARIARRLYPAETAQFVTWAYALLPAPLILSWWTFDALTTAWMLLALWALLSQRDGLSALATGLGAATKPVPVLLLPAAWRARKPRRSLAITAGVAGTAAVVILPFLWRAPAMTVASLRAQAAKSSYATVWAMIDGNLQNAEGQPVTGNFGPAVERFDPQKATLPVHNPARVPGWVTLLGAGGAYAGVWLATVKRGPWSAWGERDTVVLFAFTWAVFLLWSKGWSPQWQQMVAPLMLLVYPNRTGVLFALLLAIVSFLEWPVLLSRGMAWGYWITIPLRTALFAVWAVSLARELVRPGGEAIV